jgi:S1-C subfamily serine protease
MSRAVENIKVILGYFALAMFLGFLADAVSAEPAHDAAAAPENIREQTVLIKKDGEQLCTGTLIGDGKIVTAGHCLRGGGDLTMVDVHGHEYRVLETEHEAVPTDSPTEENRQDGNVTDWAILEIAADFYTPPETAELGCGYQPEIGDRLAAAGFPGPLKGDFIHSLLRVNAVKAGGEEFIATNGLVIGGMSGGGYYDEQGRLVGIVSHGQRGSGLQFGSSIEGVCQALD